MRSERKNVARSLYKKRFLKPAKIGGTSKPAEAMGVNRYRRFASLRVRFSREKE
jgi:hypothetical protein